MITLVTLIYFTKLWEIGMRWSWWVWSCLIYFTKYQTPTHEIDKTKCIYLWVKWYPVWCFTPTPSIVSSGNWWNQNWHRCGAVPAPRPEEAPFVKSSRWRRHLVVESGHGLHQGPAMAGVYHGIPPIGNVGKEQNDNVSKHGDLKPRRYGMGWLYNVYIYIYRYSMGI